MSGLHLGRTRPCALVAAAGATWEPEALRSLAAADVVVLKRCVDLPDLLASASSGRADVAVVAADLSGLDLDAVQRLRRDEVRLVALADAAVDPTALDRLTRLGVPSTGDVPGLAAVIDSLLAAPAAGTEVPAEEPFTQVGAGRVVAVWGPGGAPGRTTVAVALAAEHAANGGHAVLVDADPYAGSIAQHLGVLDEVSGLLATARLVNEGALDDESFTQCCRRVAGGLDVLTGLPRPDRWIEVRAGVISAVLDRAAAVGDVVVDCGFSIEDAQPHGPLGRNTTTLESLRLADEIVLVGSAEPTGLTRLARALVDVAEVAPTTPLRVVINRMRDSLGWHREDIVGMVDGYAQGVPVHFMVEDRATLDRALVAGRALTELGDSTLRGELRVLAEAVFGQAPNSR